MKIEDNFLDQEKFDELQNFIMGNEFPWHYNDAIDFQDDGKFQFVHVFMNNPGFTNSTISQVSPIIEKICPFAIKIIKANLLTKTSNIVKNIFHSDLHHGPAKKVKQWTTSIFYVNTNNGYTIFEDGTKVESIENRFITFPANVKHTGTSCTDEKTRVVINFNYFK